MTRYMRDMCVLRVASSGVSNSILVRRLSRSKLLKAKCALDLREISYQNVRFRRLTSFKEKSNLPRSSLIANVI